MLKMILRPRFTFLLSLIFMLAQPLHSDQADSENCSLCHDLASLVLMGDTGSFRNLEISSNSYRHSTHRNVICRDCHTDINTFPHPTTVQKVDCAKNCHITKPFALTGYSHVDQSEAHAISAHGKNPKYSDQKNASKPDCKYCHDNTFRNVIEDEVLAANSKHCGRCHEDAGLAGVILHVSSHSGHRSASASVKVVELCSSCHADESRMKNFDVNLTQVSGYENQFHGKALKRGMDNVANCMDCHRNHLNLPADDPNSSIHPNNIQMTCSANTYCHSNATAKFTAAAIHSKPTPSNNPIAFYVEWGFILLTAGTMAMLFAHIFLDFGRWVGDAWMRRRKQ
ncbi:MAG: hypothetical protein K9N35_10450 [Candidatus Marinimicrobia bacterium]|nr:hypothetical protein [Candidatus Neomarinimicrobiota bacterium]